MRVICNEAGCGLCSCGVGDAHVHGGPGWNVARLAGLFLNTGRKDTVSVIIILLTVSINTKTTHPPVCLILTSAYRFCPPSSPLCPVLLSAQFFFLPSSPFCPVLLSAQFSFLPIHPVSLIICLIICLLSMTLPTPPDNLLPLSTYNPCLPNTTVSPYYPCEQPRTFLSAQKRRV